MKRILLSDRTVLSLFDTTGIWSDPYLRAGCNVIAVDLKNWVPLDVTEADCAEKALELYGDVDGILAAPSCTDFAVSGAWKWREKDAAGATAASVELVLQVLRLVALYRPSDPEYDRGFFWALENPIGRIAKLVPELGQPKLIFDPCDFGGWMKKGERTHSMAPEQDAYTKRTCLYGEFAAPRFKPVPPVRACAQGSWMQRLGGKSERTKAARSATPMGFARAFFAANHWGP